MPQLPNTPSLFLKPMKIVHKDILKLTSDPINRYKRIEIFITFKFDENKATTTSENRIFHQIHFLLNFYEILKRVMIGVCFLS